MTRSGSPSAAVRGKGWDLDGWPESAAEGARTLTEMLTVLFHRYGVPHHLSSDNAGDAAEAPPHVPTIHVASGQRDGMVADLVWWPTSSGVAATWYPDVYDDETVETIAGHLRQLHAQLLAPEPPSPAEVCFLTPTEREINGGTPASLPLYPPITLHQLFQLQAWRTPATHALVMGDRQLTYRELDEASNRLAHELVDAGARPGDVIAIGGERCLGLFTALIAVLKAGGVFVYLDPALPAARLAQFVEVSRPRMLLSGPGAVALDAGLTHMTFPAEPDLAAPGRSEPPDVLVGAESPAYLLFTSGSTGMPKAVLRPHRLHTSRIFLEQSLYQLGGEDRHLLKMTISAREFFWPLATGGTAVIARPGGELDDAYLVDLMRRERISVISMVPSMLHALVANPEFGSVPALRHIFVGGEALHRALEDRVRSYGFEVHNTYTLTEADYVTHRADSGLGDNLGRSVIGTPLDMRVYLLDEDGNLVPPGLVGEIYTGGPGLANGYYGDEELTARRFVPNPFGDPRAPVLFRTGDLARHLPDGTLEYRGRRDLQVKVRGQRVEPTEVEDLIRKHPGVRNAAVVGYPDPGQGAILVAFVVHSDVVHNEDPSAEVPLREFVGQRLPSYMVPRHFAAVPQLPQLASGKIDRAALKLPERSRPADLGPAAIARTLTQQRLVAVWQRVLQLPDIGVDDDFTAVGGDSLRVMLLRSAIQDEFGVRIDLAGLMGAPTVRAQERLVEGDRAAPARDTGHQRPAAVAAEQARRAALRAGREVSR